MQIQTLNSRTIEGILGRNRYRCYLEKLSEEIGVSAAEAMYLQFQITRATDFDHGAFTDLGGWNVLVYTIKYPHGYCVVVDDKLGIPQEAKTVVCFPGGTTHNWRKCLCSSCRYYRSRLDEANESKTQ
jgi:hypothetical protein